MNSFFSSTNNEVASINAIRTLDKRIDSFKNEQLSLIFGVKKNSKKKLRAQRHINPEELWFMICYDLSLILWLFYAFVAIIALKAILIYHKSIHISFNKITFSLALFSYFPCRSSQGSSGTIAQCITSYVRTILWSFLAGFQEFHHTYSHPSCSLTHQNYPPALLD